MPPEWRTKGAVLLAATVGVGVAIVALLVGSSRPGPEQARVGAHLTSQGVDARSSEIAVVARACDRGSSADCRRLGQAYLDASDRLPLDLAHGVELLRVHCGLDDQASCVTLARYLDPSGQYVRAYAGLAELGTPGEAAELAARACAAGDAAGCTLRDEMAERERQQAELLRQQQQQFEAERQRREQELGRQRRRSALSQQVYSGVVDCTSWNELLGVPMAVCEGLSYAIRNGRTSETGREALRRYLHERGLRRVRGYIVARIDAGTYEAAHQAYDGYFDISYPSDRHFILATTLTSFSSRGRFDMWVREAGQIPVPLQNGFEETWSVFEESPVGELWQAVRDAPAGRQTTEAARDLLRYIERNW